VAGWGHRLLLRLRREPTGFGDHAAALGRGVRARTAGARRISQALQAGGIEAFDPHTDGLLAQPQRAGDPRHRLAFRRPQNDRGPAGPPGRRGLRPCQPVQLRAFLGVGFADVQRHRDTSDGIAARAGPELRNDALSPHPAPLPGGEGESRPYPISAPKGEEESARQQHDTPRTLTGRASSGTALRRTLGVTTLPSRSEGGSPGRYRTGAGAARGRAAGSAPGTGRCPLPAAAADAVGCAVGCPAGAPPGAQRGGARAASPPRDRPVAERGGRVARRPGARAGRHPAPGEPRAPPALGGEWQRPVPLGTRAGARAGGGGGARGVGAVPPRRQRGREAGEHRGGRAHAGALQQSAVASPAAAQAGAGLRLRAARAADRGARWAVGGSGGHGVGAAQGAAAAPTGGLALVRAAAPPRPPRRRPPWPGRTRPTGRPSRQCAPR